MPERPQPTTVYLQPEVKLRLQHLAVDRQCSLSSLINHEMRKMLEAAEKQPVERQARDSQLVEFLKSQNMPVPDDLYYL